MHVEGHCHCGKIAFEAEVDPDTLTICHCIDCQTLTGSAYRAAIPAPAETFMLLRGEPKIYVKTAASGTKRAHAFCRDCGTPIYSAAPENPTRYSLRLGTINERAALHPGRQIWCRSALPWVMALDGIEKMAQQ